MPDLILSENAVFVTPEPLFTRLGRGDDGVVSLMVVSGHMPVGRVIAA